MTIPAEEARAAATVLSDLEWLADEIATGQTDTRRIERQRRAAGLLFLSLDDPAKVPVLVEVMAEHQVDSSTILRWYSGSVERVDHWEQRLAYVTRALDVLRPSVERSLAELESPTRDRLMADLVTRRASLERWLEGPGPFP